MNFVKCGLHLRSLDTYLPRRLEMVTLSISRLLIFKGGMNGGTFLKLMIISLVFFPLIFTWLSSDHCTILSVSSCKWESPGSETSSLTVESSMYLCRRPLAEGSLIIMTKSSGPSQEPCRTDPFTWSQSDSSWSIHTCCLLSDRKEPIQCTRISGTS